MNEGICFPQLVVEAHTDRGNPVLAALTGVAFEDDQVAAHLLLAESGVEVREAWTDLEIRASSRELWGPAAGKHRGRIWIALSDGWWAIRLIAGDDERMARGVMRHVVDCVGRSRAVLESRLAELDSRYRLEPLPQAESPFHEFSAESRLEALLTLRLHIIEALGLDDLDEDTTVLEALREQAVEAGSDMSESTRPGREMRERLRHACAFELAIGRYLGAEALRCQEPRTRAVRQARMREAFDAACKAFSQFAELACDGASGPDVLEVGLCSIDG